MSEYQYYEFRAIDRPLNPKERSELRDLSTRAEITETSFTNTYQWGNFKGDPSTLMDRYFDAFVYVANWGTHRLMLRIPLGFLDLDAASAYCDGESLSIEAGKGHVVLEFLSEDEAGDDDGWTNGEEWMPSLILIRNDLMRGDLRALYLGWLASLYARGWDGEAAEGDDAFEPPVPPGLSKLSGPLSDLASFLRIEDELIEAAAAGADSEPPAGPSKKDLARWVEKLPDADKDAYLLRFLAEDGDVPLRAELSRRFRESTAPKKGKRPAAAAGRRTIAELLSARDALVEAKKRKTSELAAAERARLEREHAQARTQHLDALALREPETWRKVESFIAMKRPNDYDRAVTHLVDLIELADRSGRRPEAESRIRDLRQRHATKTSFLRKLNEKGLGM